MIVRPIAVTICQNCAVLDWMSCACTAAASTISVVSAGLAISTPVSAATPRRAPTSRSNPPVTTALIRHTPTTAIASDCQLAATTRKSTDMPTVIRNTPSASPLNGAVMISTSPPYSVSAIMTPAISAPTIGDSPAAAVATEAVMTTSRHAARNNSGLLVLAACANR